MQGENRLPKCQGRLKKVVQISDKITIIDFEVGDVTQVLKGLEIEEDSGRVHVDNFKDPTPPPARKKLNRAREKAQNTKYIGSDVHRI